MPLKEAPTSTKNTTKTYHTSKRPKTKSRSVSGKKVAYRESKRYLYYWISVIQSYVTVDLFSRHCLNTFILFWMFLSMRKRVQYFGPAKAVLIFGKVYLSLYVCYLVWYLLVFLKKYKSNISGSTWLKCLYMSVPSYNFCVS